MTTIDQLPEIDPFSAEFLEDPLGARERVREHSWAARSMRGVEVLDYDGCVAVLNNEDVVAGVRRLVEMMGLDIKNIVGPGRNLLLSEGEDHQRLRGVVSRWFTPRRVEEMRSAVEGLVGRLIADMTAARGGEFMGEVANRLPARVFCWMIGASEDRADELFEMTAILLQAFSGDPALADAIARESEKLGAFVNDLFEEKKRNPGDDLMTIMMEAANANTMTMDDVHSLAFEMLGASTDNTANQAGLAIEQLARHPDQWALVKKDAELIPGAIEECSRFDPRVREGIGNAERDTTLIDLEIPKETMVWSSVLAAHFDPKVFPDPHRFDVTRIHERAQLNFGVGRHYCLGAALARMEMSAILTVLRDQWTEFELDGEPTAERGFQGQVSSLPLRVKAA